MLELKIEKPHKIYSEFIEQGAIDQFTEAMKMEVNVQGALMPDSHKGYTLPIGAVVKSKGAVFPAYVGYDIGCGMCAIKVSVKKDELDLDMLRDDILNKIPIGFKKHSEPQHLDLNINGITNALASDILKTGTMQVGTLGGGNHFIEIGEANNGDTWIVIHSGSRGLGHKTADRYMKLAAVEMFDETDLIEDFARANEKLYEHNYDRYCTNLEFAISKGKEKASKNLEGHNYFDIDSPVGKGYIRDMEYCLEYALTNRERMIGAILNSIFTQVGERKVGRLINRNHNHAEVDKDGFVIHRKGATHAEKGMSGVIPGNMRDGSFIVKGLGNEDSMNSSSHGAGRVLSRRKAKETLDIDKFRELNETIVSNHTDEMLDEAPEAYKDIFEVMELQKDLVEVVDRCKPFLNIKG